MSIDRSLMLMNDVVAGVAVGRRIPCLLTRSEETPIWKETMRSSNVCGRALAASLIAFGMGLAVVPTASADPNDTDQTDTPAPGPGTGPATIVSQASDDPGTAAATACKEFGGALNYAASNYEDFAYSIAGNGAYVNYGDPDVQSNNVIGRTALRQAAAVGLDAARTPGLQPEIAGPMQAWSMDAAKLIITMGLQGNGDAINAAATDMNTDGHNVQMACAAAGTHA